MFSDIDCVFEGFGGKGRIYISGLYPASNISLLKSKFLINLDLNIKTVISVAISGLLTHKIEDIPNYLYLPA